MKMAQENPLCHIVTSAYLFNKYALVTMGKNPNVRPHFWIILNSSLSHSKSNSLLSPCGFSLRVLPRCDPVAIALRLARGPNWPPANLQLLWFPSNSLFPILWQVILTKCRQHCALGHLEQNPRFHVQPKFCSVCPNISFPAPPPLSHATRAHSCYTCPEELHSRKAQGLSPHFI